MTDKKDYQASKRLVRSFYEATEQADADLKTVFSEFVSADYHWRGMHPFYEQRGAAAHSSAGKAIGSARCPMHRHVERLVAKVAIGIVLPVLGPQQHAQVMV